ncbi:hypothetical protein GMA65_13765, partial [Turicibacter sanguinis]|nr:hypothetical protein [Turicibacter sanguinis]
MKKEKLMVTMFFSLILVLPLSYVWIDDYVDTNNYENRDLYQFPLHTNNLREFFTEFEKFFNDRLPYKNQFTKLNSIINYKIFNCIESDNVLLGDDNWLFYKSTNDGNSLADYQGTNHFNNKQLNLISERLSDYKETLQTKDIDFVLFIAPNKEQIYSAFMPTYINVINDTSRTDALVEYLKQGNNIKVVYPKKELEEASKVNLTYYKTDTHWNNYGGMVGAYALLKEITEVEIENIELAINELEYSGDLSKMVRLESQLFDSNIPI